MEPIEAEWMTFDEASAFLAIPHEELARLLLEGMLPFMVEKKSPNPDFVLRMDVLVGGFETREFQRRRWGKDGEFKADQLVNRAAMKWRKHPTRTSPGVRGKAKPKEVIT